MDTVTGTVPRTRFNGIPSGARMASIMSSWCYIRKTLSPNLVLELSFVTVITVSIICRQG